MHTSISCKGNLIDLTQPKVMAILNVTPDSFYDGGKYGTINQIIEQAGIFLSEGAHFIDIGGYSSRPGAVHVTEKEEIARVVRAIDAILSYFPQALISIDTFRSTVAKEAVAAGAALINDIAAGELDPEMFSVVGQLQVPYIMMHMRGTPQNMSGFAVYDDIISEMMVYFSKKIAKARSFGINDLILDPGIGFSKNIEQNFYVLQQLRSFLISDLPLLVGLSRKSLIYKTLACSPEQALNGTTALHMAALQNGASILRVHDVAQAMECITLFQRLQKPI